MHQRTCNITNGYNARAPYIDWFTFLALTTTLLASVYSLQYINNYLYSILVITSFHLFRLEFGTRRDSTLSQEAISGAKSPRVFKVFILMCSNKIMLLFDILKQYILTHNICSTRQRTCPERLVWPSWAHPHTLLTHCTHLWLQSLRVSTTYRSYVLTIIHTTFIGTSRYSSKCSQVLEFESSYLYILPEWIAEFLY